MSAGRCALAALTIIWLTPRAGLAESLADETPMTRITAHIEAQRFGQAVAECEALPAGTMVDALKRLCAESALSLGDRFNGLGQTELARTRWTQALSWDPALADRPDVLARLGGNASTPAVDTAPASDTASPPDATPAQPDEDAEPEVSPTSDDAPDAVVEDAAREAVEPMEDATDGDVWRPVLPVRANRHLMLGAGAGYLDGVFGLTLGWQMDPHIAVNIAFGMLYPTFDIRMRFLAFKDALTPFVGFGLLLPLSPDGRAGIDLAPMRAIYELSESFHIDVGVAWMPVPGLEVTAAVAFVTPFDQVHPDTVVFFPQLTGAVAWCF